ncbi:hypothetical protein PG997_002323 [Apiospora hydei]|uniref:Peroxisomal adenine nucleotide transporter 1 n=1 Tax=Apiospora hydei TaxID=1337664 RepID=A0ABR1X939_9PEZI
MSAQSKAAALPPWGLAVAGSTGAVLANALVYPLDIVKTRLQVQVKRNPNDPDHHHHHGNEPHYTSTWDAIQKIVASDGLAGLYAGMEGALLGVASTNFAYFYWYSTLALGAVAGALAQLCTIPVAVVTTRQQTQAKTERKSFLETGREVVEGEDGLFGLWRGLKASLVLVVNPAITYGAYERLKSGMFPSKTRLTPGEAFFLGAMSKAMATIATQPLIVAKVGLQSKPPAVRKGKPFKSFIEVMRFILDNEGPWACSRASAPRSSRGCWYRVSS